MHKPYKTQMTMTMQKRGYCDGDWYTPRVGNCKRHTNYWLQCACSQLIDLPPSTFVSSGSGSPMMVVGRYGSRSERNVLVLSIGVYWRGIVVLVGVPYAIGPYRCTTVLLLVACIDGTLAFLCRHRCLSSLVKCRAGETQTRRHQQEGRETLQRGRCSVC